MSSQPPVRLLQGNVLEVLIELSPQYIKLSEARLRADAPMFEKGG